MATSRSFLNPGPMRAPWMTRTDEEYLGQLAEDEAEQIGEALERQRQPENQMATEDGVVPLFRCRADIDGECDWPACPQLIDGEPEQSGRSCPLWVRADDDDHQEVDWMSLIDAEMSPS